MADESFSLSPRDVLRLLKDHPRRWIAPAVALAVLAGLFGVVRPRTWRASQALIIREEAAGKQPRLGSFLDLKEMKTAQETILELARSKSVLRAALAKVGPPADYDDPAVWPTAEDIVDLRECSKLAPPGGAEFGKTEVFYLKVEQHDRERAIQLAAALCDELQNSFQALRQKKYASVIEELRRSETLAEENLRAATERLGAMEKQAGADLAELRMLLSKSSSTSDLRQKLVEIENEIRDYQAKARADEQLLALLREAQSNPGRLVACPNSLLVSQPALRRLKEGLVDAQLKTAQLEGAMSPDHPLVRAAKLAQAEISEQLHKELAIAIDGVLVDLRMNAGRAAALKQQLARDQQRLERLAAMRAEYANRIAMSTNRTQLLETARANLAEAKAQRAAAGNVTLISRIDSPDAGTKPIGPGAAMLTLAGLFGGLAMGLGVVFLTVEPPAPPSRKVRPTAGLGGGDDLSLKETSRRLEREPAWG